MALIRKKDRIFIAGHKGMVGSAILRNFKKNNYLNNSFLTCDKSEIDLRDKHAVNEWFKKYKPDVVVIAAAKVGGILANSTMPVEFLLDNLKIQNNLIEASHENSVHRLLFLASSCIYPKFAEQPIKEDYLLQGVLEETNECYAIAKIAGIKLCQAFRKQYCFDTISLMPTNLYGPGDNYNLNTSHVLPALIRKFYEAKINNNTSVKCWGSGNVFREFLHVDDLSEGVIFLLRKWNPGLQNSPKDMNGNPLTILNIGTGKDISIKKLAEKISQIIGFEGLIEWDQTKPDGTFRKQLDVSKINSLGWSAKITLEEGIKRSINDFNYALSSKTLRG